MSSDGPRPNDSENPSDAAFEPDWDAIARVLAGESTADERARIERWLERNPAERELLAQLEAARRLHPSSDVDVEGALARVHAKMTEMGRSGERFESRRILAWPEPLRSKAAIALLAAAAVVAIVVTLRRSPVMVPSTATPPAPRTYATLVGQRDSVILGDGSRVLLGPDTRLTVPSDYGARSRQVELRGDAYFDVRHDSRQPFSVRVGSALIEDVGTTFTVESDDADTTHIAVVTGSVRVRANNAPATSGVVLEAGDGGAIDRAGRASVLRRSVRAEDTAWTTGQVVFRNASLARVAVVLRRWYGVRLQVTDPSLRNQHLNTSFNGEPVDQVLTKIGLMLGASVLRRGDTATLTPAHGPAIAR